MKKTALFVTFLAAIAMSSTLLWAEQGNETENWRDLYRAALENGRQAGRPDGSIEPAGLAYSPSEQVVLETAISTALAENKGDRVCECLKMAVDYGYNSYSVLKTIYSVGRNLEIDQLCMCATEAGILKAIVAKAAKDAITPLNEPIYQLDEITQSQCLRGLAYTVAEAGLETISLDPAGDNVYASPFTP